MLFAPWRSHVKGALVLCLLTVFCAACGAFGFGCSREPQQAATPQGGTPADSPASRTDDERPKIVVLGDSLTAGLGLLETQSYPHLLQEKIDRDGFHYEVVNAGVSGDTTAGGLRRLDWTLQEDVRVLIVALGGNDGLRGLSVSEMKQNLGQIIETARSKNAIVILAGMEAPPNYGAEYAASFRQAYRELAREVQSALYSISPRQGRGSGVPQPGGRHPSQSTGRRDRGGHGLDRAEAAPGPDIRLMIELRGVSKSVPSGSGTLTILHPIDLVVPAGEVVAITGASGSGKSTLLGLIAGLDAPTSGRIIVDGVDITALDEDALARLRGRRIGFVFQFFHLLPSLTALENILVPMEIAGLPDARARAKSLLNEVGLSERGHHYPSQLSGGEQQRVAIARALANEPPLLLADEPTGNLDSSTGRQIIDLLLDVNRSRGTTLVLVTHDPDLASMAHMSIALRDGRVVSQTQGSGLTAQGSGLRAQGSVS